MNFMRKKKRKLLVHDDRKGSENPFKPLIEGKLYVCLNSKGSWKARWVKLYEDRLLVFKGKPKNREKKEYLNWIFAVDQFVQVVVIKKQLKGRNFAFTLSNFNISHLFSGDTKSATDYWYHGLGGVIKKLQSIESWYETPSKSSQHLESQYKERVSSFIRERGENPESKEAVETEFESFCAIADIAVHEAKNKLRRAKAASKRIENEELSFLKDKRRRITNRLSHTKSQLRGHKGHQVVSKDLSVLLREYTKEELLEEEEFEKDMEKLKEEIFEQQHDETEKIHDEEERLLVPSIGYLKQERLSNRSENLLLESVASKDSVKTTGTAPDLKEEEEVLDGLVAQAEQELKFAKKEEELCEAKLKMAQEMSSVIEKQRKEKVLKLHKSKEKVKKTGRKKGPTFTSMVLEFERLDTLLKEEKQKLDVEEDMKTISRKEFMLTISTKPSPTVLTTNLENPSSSKYLNDSLAGVSDNSTRKTPFVEKESMSEESDKGDSRKIRKEISSVQNIATKSVPLPIHKCDSFSSEEEFIVEPKTEMSVNAILNLWQKKIDENCRKRATNLHDVHFPVKERISCARNNPTYQAQLIETAKLVEKEIGLLIDKIKELGEYDSEAAVHNITFRVLFEAYIDVSDSLVGVLMRAKKKGVIKYQGSLLFVGVHDNVIICLPD